MPTRDYLIRQFEEMGFFLASLLQRIQKIKEQNEQESIELLVQEELSGKFELNLADLIVLENEDFLDLIKTYFPSDENLEQFADILKAMGENLDFSFLLSRANYLLKSLLIFKHLQEKSADFSMSRSARITEIQEILLRHHLTENL